MSRERRDVKSVIDRKIVLLMLFVVAVVSGGIAVSETLTIMTSYPVPSGIYTQLITTGGSALKPVNTIFNRSGGNTILVPSATCTDTAHCMVGVGTSTPATTLDVNGSIRPGTANTASACSAEGALAYDNVAHAPVYCNGASWASVSSQSGPTILADGWYTTEVDNVIPFTKTGKILLTIQFGGGQGGSAGINITFYWGLGSLANTQIMNNGGVDYQTPFSPSLATTLSPAAPGSIHVMVHTVNVLGGYGAPSAARILAVQF